MTCLLRTLLASLLLAAASSSTARAASGHAADDELALAAAQLAASTTKPVLIGAPSGVSVQAALADPANCINNGSWSAVVNWTPHIPVSAANLPDGRILTFASNQRTSFPVGPEFTYAATWNPTTGAFQEFNNTTHDMFCGGITLMTDGRVMVNGGRNETPFVSIFDWRTNTWTRVQNMNGGRWYNTSVSLANGDVFTATGGDPSVGIGTKTTERWSSAGWTLMTGIGWSAVTDPDPGYFRHWHPFISVAPDGRLLHFGPTDTMHWFNVTGTGSFVNANATVPGAHYPKEGCWVMYDEGKALVAGGGETAAPSAGDSSIGISTNLAYTVNMTSNPPTVSATGSMQYPRQFANTVVLPSGEVLVMGGNSPGAKFSDNGSIMPCEIWNPNTGTWRTVASISVPRNYHSIALLLPDGRVLSGGGGLGGGDHRDAQLYSPPCLFTSTGALATRPVLNTAPAKIGPGNVFSVVGTAGLVKFSMIRMAALTHSVNTDQRYLSVPFTETSAGNYQLTAHSNRNVMTPGHWMLYGINSTGAFSVAKIIQVDATSAISVTNPGDQSSTVGTAVSLQISATGTGLAYSATGLPAGLSINSSTGLISGTPTTSGSTTVRVTASANGQSVSQDFTWFVLLSNTGSGKILREWWLNIPNADLNSLTTNTAYPNSPTGSDQLTSFETPTNWADNLGQRVRGYVIPPVTGQYRFWIASDDEGRLILSTNNNPANGATIASIALWANPREWTKYPEQASALITLQGGQPYYIEALMKEGGGGDNLSVAWQIPGTVGPTLIAGQYLSPWQTNRAPTITNPGNRTNVVGSAISLNITATDADNDALSFSATALPTGLTINSSTGVINGTPSVVGTFNTVISVTDNKSPAVTASFVWSIVNQVTINPVAPTTATSSGTAITYTASSAGGVNTRYKWSWGDGTADTAFSSTTTAAHTYAAPGRYQITLTATDDTGRLTTYTFYQAINAPLTAQRPTASSTIIYEARTTANSRVWTVNSDNNSVSVFDVVTRARLAEISVGTAPRALALAPNGNVWVSNIESSTLSIISGSTLAVVQTITLPRGSRPFGIAFSPSGTDGWIGCEGTGLLLRMNPTTGAQVASLSIGTDARHVSVSADSARVLVTRFITPLLPGETTATLAPTSTSGGEVFSVLTSNLSIEKKTILLHSDRPDSISSGRGIPNYLGPAIISPDNLSAWVPSKQDNVKRGMLRDGSDLNNDQTIRSIASRIPLTSGSPALTDDSANRVDLDNAGIAVNGAFESKGIYLFTALEGSREVGIVDVWNKKEIARFSAGRAPQGIALSPDGRTVFVQNFMDRTITVHDAGAIIDGRLTQPTLSATLNCITTERLAANVLLGKKHFYDAADRRIAFEQYVSCASCHNDGGHDGRVWDFTGFGEGLRNTITLRGQGGMRNGPVHWTGNFDEIQDFENQIRNLPHGTGFIPGDPNPPLGAPNAGRSADLDALAQYVSTLTATDASPYRNSDGSLTTSAQNGKLAFTQNSCAGCHSGTRFTDSAIGKLNNVGTLKLSSGTRLGQPLTGLDTPTLRGVWNTGPYLHDGSAATLDAAIAAHTTTPRPSPTQLADIVNYLKQIDDNEPSPSLTNFGVALTAPSAATAPFQVSGSAELNFTGLELTDFVITNGTASNLLVLAPGNAFSITVTPSSAGSVTVQLAAASISASGTPNRASNTTATSYSLANRAPVVTTPTTQSTVRGTTASLQILASDPDGNPLTHSATGLPAGLTINSATGLISGTVSTLAVVTTTVVVTVSDGSLSATASFTWNTTAPSTGGPNLVGTDIGSVAPAGSTSLSNGVYTVKGAGDNIWYIADGFHFASTAVTGDADIRARLTSMTNSGAWAKAGVMIRETNAAGSRHAATISTPAETGFGFDMVYRLTTGGATADSYFGNPNPVPNNWVRLTRVGNVVTSYVSANGTTWIQIGTLTYTSLPATMLYGLAVTSYNNGTLCTATFDNVQITGGTSLTTPPAPTNLAATNASTGVSLTWTDVATNEASYRVERATGTGAYAVIASLAAGATSYTDASVTAATTYNYTVSAVNTAGVGSSTPVTITTPPGTGLTLTGADIGAVSVAGSNSVSGGVYTVKGSGDNIYYIADSFRFASTSISGDADIRARLTSMTNTGDWAKAGVMIRESSAEGSRHAMLFSTPAEPGNGFDMIYRTATNGTTADSYYGNPNPVPNNWMRLTRVGNVITSYVSVDGTSWTKIDAITFTSLPATMLYGLGVTSYNNGTLCTATFDNVQIITGTVAPLAARTTTTLASPTPTSSLTTSTLSTTQDTSGATSLSFTRAIGSTASPTLQLIDDLTKSPTGWRTSTRSPTIVSNGDGTETLSFSSLSAAFSGDQGFARIHLEQDLNGDGFADLEENGDVFGFTRRTYVTGTTTFGNAFASPAIGTAQVSAVQSSGITLSASLPSFKPGTSYYLEVIRGTNQGHRFDLDETTVSGARVSIETSNARSTLSTLPSTLVGDTVVVRAHQTVSGLFPEASFVGTTSALTADRLMFYNGSAYEILWLQRKSDGTKCWVRSGDATSANAGSRVMDVAEGAIVQLRSAKVTLTTSGMVRGHRVALPLKSGSQLIANIAVGSVSLKTFGLTTAAGFVATTSAASSDRVDLFAADEVANAAGFRSLALLANGTSSQWTDVADLAMTDLSNAPLIGAMRAIFIKSTNSKSTFFVPANWRP